jgi:tetratricopeptide (TPR) repeat protein
MIRIRTCILFLLLISFCPIDTLAQSETQKKTDSLSNILKAAKEDTGKLNTLIHLTEQYLDNDDLASAEVFSEQSRSLAAQLNIKSGWASVYNLLGKIEQAKENYLNAERNFKTALSINEEINNKRGAGTNLCNIVYTYYLQGKDGPGALKMLKSSIEKFDEIGDQYGRMKAMLNRGIILSGMGNYPEALKNLYSSLKSARELGDKDVIAATLQEIGICFRYEGNYPEAFKNLNESLKIRRALNKKIGIAGILASIAMTYEKQGNHDEALKTFYECLIIIDQKKHRALTAFLLGQVGNILATKGNYKEAMKNHQAALKTWDELGGRVGGWAITCTQIGKLLFTQAAFLNPQEANANYIEALHYLNRVLTGSEKEVSENKKDTYQTLADVFRAMANYKKALEYYTLYVAMKDTLMNNETLRKLEQQRTQYEVEKAVEEEKIKNAIASAEQKAELKRKNELMMMGLALFGVISFFIVLLIRQRNQKRRSVEKAETGHKMAELELQSLRAQLNPHFMFNSLNAIQDLIVNENNEKSHLYLSRFSKLLRMLLDNADQPFVTVKQELELLELYLSLENLRIPNLQYSIEKDPKLNAEERMIPNMMLQPYIENAIWHGLSNKKGERKLQIRIHENGNATEFEVEDNGIGRKRSEELKQQFRHGHHSKGMQLLSKRFELLSKEYGTAIQTTITDLENNGDAIGTLVKIDVPFILSEQAKQLAKNEN